jgi:serine/threonine protein kinase
MGVSYAADLTSQVLAALHAVHQLGIVHRDLKPDNVMVVHRRPDEPIAKVLDFGIAQGVLGDAPDETGRVFGTAEYMPPEQARGEVVDARADLYAAGVMLFELLTGTVPFGGETPMEILTNMLTNSPPRASQFVRDLPRELDLLVNRALSKSKAQRPQSAREFLTALAPFTTQRRPPSILPMRDSEHPLPLVTPGLAAKVPKIEVQESFLSEEDDVDSAWDDKKRPSESEPPMPALLTRKKKHS